MIVFVGRGLFGGSIEGRVCLSLEMILLGFVNVVV